MNRNDRLLLDSFESNFGAFRSQGVPLALYGIGVKTQLVLEHAVGYNIVGLMDKDTVGKTIYGYPVLSYEEVISRVKLVIIVANLSVNDLIHQRISFLQDHGIRILRIDGSEPASPAAGWQDDPYFDSSSEGLRKQIDAHDVISFDLFDTLVMRRVLSPPDIFDLVEGELVSRYGSGFDFKAERIKAERLCYNESGAYFTLRDVYDRLGALPNLTAALADEMRAVELALEMENCIPRAAVAAALEYAADRGKHVCITTDTYLQEAQILSLIERCGITRYDRVHISSEARKSKSDGTMWQYFTEIYAGKKVLHVGDNRVSDIDNARKAGIDAFEVKSAPELMGISSMRHLGTFSDRLSSRLMLGRFAARLLNDPFVCHKSGGLLKVDTMYDVGYLSFGPLVLDFLLWLIRSSAEHGVEKLLFFSRDGYLLERLYRSMAAKLGAGAPPGAYFLTSRRAASVAAIYDLEDVSFIIDKMCDTKKVTIGQILQTAFAVRPDSNDSFMGNSFFQVSKERVTEYLARHYAAQILEVAAKERENYLRYIRSLDILNQEKIACVNYVGRGVTQRCVSKIIGKELRGYYFATQIEMLDTLPSLDQVSALYGELTNLYTGDSAIVSKCLFGEVVLSSPDEQLINFDHRGEPVFQGSPGERDFSSVAECHRGITAYVDDMLKSDSRLMERRFDAKLVASFYDLFSSRHCLLSESVKSSFVFSDYYDPNQASIRLFPEEQKR